MIIEIILLILAVPVGFLIAWMARDELKNGRKWFRAIFITFFSFGGLFWIYGLDYLALTCAFIAIVGLISFIKGNK
ncbi:MAG TPA: hypothetical protein VI544_01410 [Candidatus Nanoarchaeia archaeon]|nr:hypothetical protein [Candidatus Nanoarchaeia archaeon]